METPLHACESSSLPQNGIATAAFVVTIIHISLTQYLSSAFQEEEKFVRISTTRTHVQ